jgi:hypothetical protein
MRRYCDNEGKCGFSDHYPSPSCEAAKSMMQLLPHLRGKLGGWRLDVVSP